MSLTSPSGLGNLFGFGLNAASGVSAALQHQSIHDEASGLGMADRAGAGILEFLVAPSAAQ